MISLRKKESEKIYQKREEEKGCFICNKDLLAKEYSHWVILKNRYPYDAIASRHDLLCPKRHISDREELTINELAELREIRKANSDIYSFEMWNYPSKQTHKVHFHLHLLVFKEMAPREKKRLIKQIAVLILIAVVIFAVLIMSVFGFIQADGRMPLYFFMSGVMFMITVIVDGFIREAIKDTWIIKK